MSFNPDAYFDRELNNYLDGLEDNPIEIQKTDDLHWAKQDMVHKLKLCDRHSELIPGDWNKELEDEDHIYYEVYEATIMDKPHWFFRAIKDRL